MLINSVPLSIAYLYFIISYTKYYILRLTGRPTNNPSFFSFRYTKVTPSPSLIVLDDQMNKANIKLKDLVYLTLFMYKRAELDLRLTKEYAYAFPQA